MNDDARIFTFGGGLALALTPEAMACSEIGFVDEHGNHYLRGPHNGETRVLAATGSLWVRVGLWLGDVLVASSHGIRLEAGDEARLIVTKPRGCP